LWDIFLEELKTRVASKTYTSEDVAILISLKETRNILSNIQGSPNDYSRKIKNEILDSKLIDNFKKQNKEKDLLKKYKKEAEEILEEKEGKLGEMNKIFSNINKNIEEKCSKFWPRAISITLVIILIGVLCMAYWAWCYFSSKPDASTYNIFNTLCAIIIPLVILTYFIFWVVVALLFKKEINITPTFFINLRRFIENKAINACIIRKKKIMERKEEGSSNSPE
jgi:hypothetical protein